MEIYWASKAKAIAFIGPGVKALSAGFELYAGRVREGRHVLTAAQQAAARKPRF